MTSELQFIELTKADITDVMTRDITALLPQLAPGAGPVTTDWLHYLFDSGTRLFAAIDNGKIVGTVLLCRMVILVGQKDWIEDVVVDQHYRGQGIAGRLMDMAEAASRAGRAKSLNLTSSAARTAARSLYEKRGYVRRDSDVFRLSFNRSSDII